MPRLLPLKPILDADLMTLSGTTRVWSSRASLVLDEPSDWLRAADGSRSLGQVLQGATDQVSALRVLHALDEATLLAEGAVTAPPRIAVVGHGRLAHDLCAALARHRVHLVLAGPARPGAFHTGGHPLGSATWDPETAPGALATFGHQEHWSHLSADSCDQVVIAAETCEPDRAIGHHLRSQRLAHLVVKAHRDSATIGPWWSSPQDPCLGCIDLVTRDQDPGWAQVLMTLNEREADPRAEVSLAAAALATQRLRNPATTTEVIVAQPDGIRHEQWPRHPECRDHQLRAAPPELDRPASGRRADSLRARYQAAA